MAPDIAGMTAEEPLGQRVCSSVREVKLMPEHGLKEELIGCNQKGTHYHTGLCSEEPFGKICHGRITWELLSPCECSGSLAMVHRACIEHWLTASNSSHHEFALESLPKPLTEVSVHDHMHLFKAWEKTHTSRYEGGGKRSSSQA